MGIIRLLLALGVAFEHSGYAIGVGSYTAVQAFFVVSGFYMQLILSSGKYTTTAFYKSRCWRLFPAYWIIAIIALATFGITHAVFHIETTPLTYYDKADLSFSQYLFLSFANLGIVSSDIVWFFPNSFGESHPVHLLLITPIWTISLELVFYMICPWFAKRSSLFLLGIIAVLTALRVISYQYGLDGNPWHARFILFELPFFIAGMLVYRQYHAGRMQGRIFGLLTLPLCAFLLLMPMLTNWLQLPAVYHRPDYILSLIFYALLLLTLPFIFARSRKNAIDRYIGEYSYPVYLIHYIFVCVLIHGGTLSGKTGAFAVVSISMGLSFFVVRYIQSPIDEYRHKIFVTAQYDADPAQGD